MTPASDRAAMPALTLWPEWLPTITHLGKRIENRSWAPPRRIIRRTIALHAGRTVGGGAPRKGLDLVADTALHAGGWEVEWVRRTPWSSEGPPYRMTAIRDGAHGVVVDLHPGHVVALARVVVGDYCGINAGAAACAPWGFPGCWHWHLDQVEVLDEPIPARGRQGIWTWTPPGLLITTPAETPWGNPR